MSELGDVQINGNWYRIDLQSYRMRDIIDFSPRAATPGGGVVMSDLMLYQPLLQSDWRHGIGFNSFDDSQGYQWARGIDTRHEGVAMMFTNPVSSDTGDYHKSGAMIHKNVPYFWGTSGIRKYSGGAWSTITPNPITTVTVTNPSFETFTSPNFSGWTNVLGSGAIAQTTTTGEFYDLTAALKITCGATDNTSIKQTLTVTPGYIYTLKFYSRSDLNTNGVGRFQVYDETNMADIVATKNCTYSLVTSTYALTTETFTCPAGCVSLSIIFKPNATNAVSTFFDGVTLTSTNQPTANTNMMLSLGTNMFVVPYQDRIMRSVYSGEIKEQPSEARSFDTYISASYPTTAYYKSPDLAVGSHFTANQSCHSILKFPLDKLPTSATLTEVKLTLYCRSTQGTVPDITISRLLQTGVMEMGADWNTYNGSSSWNTAGGTGSGTDIAATPLCTVASPAIVGGSFYTFTLDPTEFSNFITGTNTGMLIHETTLSPTNKNSAMFASSTEANYDWRPYLTFKYTLPEDWVDTGVDENAKDYHWATIYNGYVYFGVRDTNQVHYSSVETLTDLEGDTTDTNILYIGGGSYPTLRSINYLSALYIARADGLWSISDDKIARRILDFSAEVSEDNFASLVEFNGYLIFPIRDVIYQWNGSRLARITPARISDTWPFTAYSNFKNFVRAGDFLYCTARLSYADSQTYYEDLLCYDGVGWHVLTNLLTGTSGSVSLLFYDTDNNYMWYHVDGSTQVTYYIPFNANNEFPYASFKTSTEFLLYSSVHDMGFARVTKSSPSILVEADNVTDNTYLSIYYKTDEDASWTTWGTITDPGITELTNPNSVITEEYKKIQLAVGFYTTVATASPILKSLTLRFLMRPDIAYGWNFNIIAADHFVYGEHQDLRTAAAIIADLKTARDSKAPIVFIDLEGTSHYAYVSAISETAQERNVGEENANIPSIESIVNVNIVEAR